MCTLYTLHCLTNKDCKCLVTFFTLIVDTTFPLCSSTLEERVKHLAATQNVIASYLNVEPPERFNNVTAYFDQLRREVTNFFFIPFDADSDNVLGRHEFHLLFLDLLSTANFFERSEICEADYLTFCDGNGDGSVGMDELEQCTGTLPCKCLSCIMGLIEKILFEG